MIRRLFGHSAIRYLVAGGVSFLIDFGLLAVLHEVFRWPAGIASGVAFLVSFGFTYTVQRIFSFNSQAPHGGALLRYGILVGINTLITIGIVAVITKTPLGWAGGKVVATAVTTVWNYFAYRYWVFAHKPVVTPQADDEPVG